MKFITDLIVRLLGYAFLVFTLKKQGREEERLEAQKEELDAVKDANNIRDRLKHDPDYARRVRDRFTRHD